MPFVRNKFWHTSHLHQLNIKKYFSSQYSNLSILIFFGCCIWEHPIVLISLHTFSEFLFFFFGHFPKNLNPEVVGRSYMAKMSMVWSRDQPTLFPLSVILTNSVKKIPSICFYPWIFKMLSTFNCSSFTFHFSWTDNPHCGIFKLNTLNFLSAIFPILSEIIQSN